MNKVIDMAFAMLMLRILGPADAGNYYLAVVVIGWFDIFANFGLNTMLTREVAKDREQANRYLANTTILRMALCVVSVPVLGGFFLLRRYTAPLNPAAILAISLFGVALVPSNLSAGLSALFNAYERMEVPAFVTIVTTLLRVSLGVLALVMGSGYVGLAAVSIVVNVITAGILYVLVRRLLFRPRVEIDLGFQKQMLIESYPLMVNHLLATLFFKVAVLLLEWLLKDPAVVGWYSTAYKYVDAVGTIPAYFTVAIFPLMARFAATSKDSLLRAYRLAVKLLLIIAVPGAVLGSALAYPLIGLLGGSQYLPDAALILRVMIWYMPFGFINSVTQYVLIALNQQRFLTRAFAVGLAFNVLANLVLIPRFGYVAAAYVAVLSELALLVPFYVGIRRNLARIPWLGLGWKQAASAVPLAVLLVLLPGRRMLLSLPLGIAAYLAGLGLLQVFDGEEKEVVGRVLPWSALRGRLAGAWARLVDSGPNGR
jgi:O-antigen/teichoic acid export membrane protein